MGNSVPSIGQWPSLREIVTRNQFLHFVVHVQRLCLCPAILSGDQGKSDGGWVL